MIRLSFDAIGGVFLHLLNSSLSNAEVPDSWKHSLVYSIHKSGDPSDPSNFRPIDQLHVVGIYHVLKAHNFPEFLGYVI